MSSEQSRKPSSCLTQALSSPPPRLVIGLSQLPNELVLTIVEFLFRRDLHALCVVSKRFYAVANPRLYEEFVPVGGDTRCEHGRFCQYLTSLTRKPSLGLYCRRLEVGCGDVDGWDEMAVVKFLSSAETQPFKERVACTGGELLTRDWEDAIWNRYGFAVMTRAQLTLLLLLVPNLETLFLGEVFSEDDKYRIPWSGLCSARVGALQNLFQACLKCVADECFNDILCLPRLKNLHLNLQCRQLLPCRSPARCLRDIRVSITLAQLTYFHPFIAAQEQLEALTFIYFGREFCPATFGATLLSQRSTLKSLRLHIGRQYDDTAEYFTFDDWTIGTAISQMDKLDLLDVNYECLVRMHEHLANDASRDTKLRQAIPSSVTQLGIRWIQRHISLPKDLSVMVMAFAGGLRREFQSGFHVRWTVVSPTLDNIETVQQDSIDRCSEMARCWSDVPWS